jgi:hypothetical protein
VSCVHFIKNNFLLYKKMSSIEEKKDEIVEPHCIMQTDIGGNLLKMPFTTVFKLPDRDQLPDWECIATSDLFDLIEAKSASVETYNVEGAVFQQLEARNRMYIYLEQEHKVVNPEPKIPIFRLPFSGIHIIALPTLLLRYRFFILKYIGEFPIGTFRGVARTHGSVEELYTPIPTDDISQPPPKSNTGFKNPKKEMFASYDFSEEPQRLYKNKRLALLDLPIPDKIYFKIGIDEGELGTPYYRDVITSVIESHSHQQLYYKLDSQPECADMVCVEADVDEFIDRQLHQEDPKESIVDGKIVLEKLEKQLPKPLADDLKNRGFENIPDIVMEITGSIKAILGRVTGMEDFSKITLEELQSRGIYGDELTSDFRADITLRLISQNNFDATYMKDFSDYSKVWNRLLHDKGLEGTAKILKRLYGFINMKISPENIQDIELGIRDRHDPLFSAFAYNKQFLEHIKNIKMPNETKPRDDDPAWILVLNVFLIRHFYGVSDPRMTEIVISKLCEMSILITMYVVQKEGQAGEYDAFWGAFFSSKSSQDRILLHQDNYVMYFLFSFIHYDLVPNLAKYIIFLRATRKSFYEEILKVISSKVISPTYDLKFSITDFIRFLERNQLLSYILYYAPVEFIYELPMEDRTRIAVHMGLSTESDLISYMEQRPNRDNEEERKEVGIQELRTQYFELEKRYRKNKDDRVDKFDDVTAVKFDKITAIVRKDIKKFKHEPEPEEEEKKDEKEEKIPISQMSGDEKTDTFVKEMTEKVLKYSPLVDHAITALKIVKRPPKKGFVVQKEDIPNKLLSIIQEKDNPMNLAKYIAMETVEYKGIEYSLNPEQIKQSIKVLVTMYTKTTAIAQIIQSIDNLQRFERELEILDRISYEILNMEQSSERKRRFSNVLKDITETRFFEAVSNLILAMSLLRDFNRLKD